jgi:Zn finger protein HypA/HybF involved in hydrogenase expression
MKAFKCPHCGDIKTSKYPEKICSKCSNITSINGRFLTVEIIDWEKELLGKEDKENYQLGA